MAASPGASLNRQIGSLCLHCCEEVVVVLLETVVCFGILKGGEGVTCSLGLKQPFVCNPTFSLSHTFRCGR